MQSPEPDSNIRFLGTVPEFYDRFLGPVIFEPHARELASRVNVAPGDVLELACGTGILTEQLRAHLPADVRLLATDLNQPMVDYARRKLGAFPSLEWRTADAAALPFTAGSFAAVACQFGYMFVPDKDAAFREARRVLAEGGLFAFNVWDSFAHNPFGRIAHYTIASFFSSNPPEFYEVPFSMHDPELLRRLLDANGFTDLQMETVTLNNHSSSARAFATGLVRGNPVCITIKERGVALEPVIDAVEAALAREGGAQPFHSTTQARVVTARAGPGGL